MKRAVCLDFYVTGNTGFKVCFKIISPTEVYYFFGPNTMCYVGAGVSVYKSIPILL